jgi:hypothetical protein
VPSVPARHLRRKACWCASQIQGKDCDHAQTAATSERAVGWQVSTVAYKGKLYYVYPTATKDRILVGNQAQYNAYKQAVVAYGLATGPDFVEETYGPHRILIQRFDGFGPLGD